MQKTSLATQIKVVTAASIGGGLEFYDFVVYVFFANALSKLFFPKADHFAAILAVFGVFTAGYISRPIGSIIFGHIGDRYGRKKGLMYTIMLIGVSTTLMALLPTYNAIGEWAPILLVIVRVLQGLAVGGDLTGGITFVAEFATNKNRGFLCSIVFLGVNAGLLVASGVGALITGVLSDHQIALWGWRLAFFIGIFITIVGYYIRSHLNETPLFKNMEENKKKRSLPLAHLLKTSSWPLLKGIGLVWLFAVIISQVFIYMPHVLGASHIDLHEALIISTISTAIFTLLIPCFGWLSDQWGHKRIALIGALLFIILTIPLYYMITDHGLTAKIIGILVFDIISACFIGAAPSMLPELFKTDIRFTAVSLAYNISFAIFGGLAPAVLTILIHYYHSALIGTSIVLMISAIVTFLATLVIADRKGKALID